MVKLLVCSECQKPAVEPENAWEVKPDVIFCAECGEPMARGTAKTDQNGQPVSEECYLCKLRKEQRAKLPKEPQTP
jgi:formylmethanofuran dehydrogenase subunit E